MLVTPGPHSALASLSQVRLSLGFKTQVVGAFGSGAFGSGTFGSGAAAQECCLHMSPMAARILASYFLPLRPSLTLDSMHSSAELKRLGLVQYFTKILRHTLHLEVTHVPQRLLAS